MISHEIALKFCDSGLCPILMQPSLESCTFLRDWYSAFEISITNYSNYQLFYNISDFMVQNVKYFWLISIGMPHLRLQFLLHFFKFFIGHVAFTFSKLLQFFS